MRSATFFLEGTREVISSIPKRLQPLGDGTLRISRLKMLTESVDDIHRVGHPICSLLVWHRKTRPHGIRWNTSSMFSIQQTK